MKINAIGGINYRYSSSMQNAKQLAKLQDDGEPLSFKATVPPKGKGHLASIGAGIAAAIGGQLMLLSGVCIDPAPNMVSDFINAYKDARKGGE